MASDLEPARVGRVDGGLELVAAKGLVRLNEVTPWSAQSPTCCADRWGFGAGPVAKR